MKRKTLCISASVLMTFPAIGSAALISDSVDFACLNCGPPTLDSFVVVAGGGPELTKFDQFTVDVEDSSLTIGWIFSNSSIISDLQLEWTSLNWVGMPDGEITGVSFDPASTWGTGGLLEFTADSVRFTNNGDSVVQRGDFMTINLETNHSPPPSSVPDSGSAAVLFSLSLLGLFGCRKGRKTC